jgi:hypothetical protein
LEPVQERGARYEVTDELMISAPSLDNRAWIHFAFAYGAGRIGVRIRTVAEIRPEHSLAGAGAVDVESSQPGEFSPSI